MLKKIGLFCIFLLSLFFYMDETNAKNCLEKSGNYKGVTTYYTDSDCSFDEIKSAYETKYKDKSIVKMCEYKNSSTKDDIYGGVIYFFPNDKDGDRIHLFRIDKVFGVEGYYINYIGDKQNDQTGNAFFDDSIQFGLGICPDVMRNKLGGDLNVKKTYDYKNTDVPTKVKSYFSDGKSYNDLAKLLIDKPDSSFCEKVDCQIGSMGACNCINAKLPNYIKNTSNSDFAKSVVDNSLGKICDSIITMGNKIEGLSEDKDSYYNNKGMLLRQEITHKMSVNAISYGYGWDEAPSDAFSALTLYSDFVRGGCSDTSEVCNLGAYTLGSGLNKMLENIANSCINYDKTKYEESLKAALNNINDALVKDQENVNKVYQTFVKKPVSYYDSSMTESCEGIFGETLTGYMQSAFNIIKYAGIVLLVIMSSLDFIKAVATQDNDSINKAKNKTSKRFVFAILLFLLPTLLNLIIEILEISSSVCGIK